MSLDAMKQALEALEECTAYTSSESWSPSMTRECETAITALRAAIEQAKPISNPDGLNQELLEALKELLRCPAGDYDTTDDYENAVKRARAAIEQARLEQHEQAMTDAIIGGTGVMLGDKRIDPAIHYCHRFAILMECVMLGGVDKYWDEMGTLLDEYHKARDAWMTAHGQPYVSGFGKD